MSFMISNQGLNARELVRVFIFSVVICTSVNLKSQNLVPNPSFEDLSSCPTSVSTGCPNPDVGSWDVVDFWTRTNCSSPDVYNSCSSSHWISTPNNIFGEQIPR